MPQIKLIRFNLMVRLDALLNLLFGAIVLEELDDPPFAQHYVKLICF
jgi:hypothetical protein